MKTRQFLASSLMAVMLVALTGCGTPNPREPAKLTSFEETHQFTTVWSASCGESVTGLLMPAVFPDAVYAAGGNVLYRLNPENGDTVWEAKLKGGAIAGVGSDNQYIAVGNTLGEVEVFGNDGKRLWTSKLSGEMNLPPLVGSNLVICRTSDTRVTAFNAATGERLWRYQGQQPALTLRVAGAMKFSPAGILIGQSNGRLLALNGDGKPVFDIPVAQAQGITEVDRLIDVVGAPWVDSYMMCAAAYQGNVLCISAKDGHRLWQTPVDAASGPVADGENMYIATSNGEIKALSYENGRVRWTNKDYRWRSPSAGVVINNALVFGDYDGEIHALDVKTGKTIARTSVSGAVRAIPVPMADGVLIQSAKGKVVYLKIASK